MKIGETVVSFLEHGGTEFRVEQRQCVYSEFYYKDAKGKWVLAIFCHRKDFMDEDGIRKEIDDALGAKEEI